jgi:hypothetical protein
MSAGELFELIRPSVLVVAALISTWVLASARKRFPIYVALGWALGTLFLPLVVVPAYLVVILLWRRRAYSPRRPLVLPLIYGLVATAAIVTYFYFDSRTVDAHLARAARAKLVEDHGTVIREYHGALALEDNPHTRKLLALELMQAGYLSDAISEFRLAEWGGEPDDSIHFYLGLLLERIDQSGQARLEFEKFLMTQECQSSDSTGDRLCASARSRLEAINERNPRAF